MRDPLILAVAFLATGCARDLSIFTRIRHLDAEPPRDCVALGEISGRDGALGSPSLSKDDQIARYQAWKMADSMGATHVRAQTKDTSPAGYRIFVVTGTAFRCPPGVDPATR